MKRRAKFSKLSIVDSVAEYLSGTPGANVPTIAHDLGLTNLQVQGSLKGVRKKLSKQGTESSGTTSETPLAEKDIIALARMGVPTVERILRLLKAMQ